MSSSPIASLKYLYALSSRHFAKAGLDASIGASFVMRVMTSWRSCSVKSSSSVVCFMSAPFGVGDVGVAIVSRERAGTTIKERTMSPNLEDFKPNQPPTPAHQALAAINSDTEQGAAHA